jgi:hypothetical protein
MRWNVILILSNRFKSMPEVSPNVERTATNLTGVKNSKKSDFLKKSDF